VNTWDGDKLISLAGSEMWTAKLFRSLQLIARPGCLFAGSRIEPVHVSCHGGAYYQDGPAPPALREHADCSNTTTELRRKLLIKSRRNAHAGQTSNIVRRDTSMRLIQIYRRVVWTRRLQLGSSIRETMEHPCSRETASWFYVFGSAAFVVFMLQIVTGIMLALMLCAFGRRSLNSLHAHYPGQFTRALVAPNTKNLNHMNQNDRNHKYSSPSHAGSNEPTECDIVMRGLKTVPGFSGRRT